MSRAAFWKSIVAEPDDDTVRLAFADWLDENGDAALAEFIRVQIELTRIEPWTERAVDLAIRERVLLRDNRKAWLDALPSWVPRKDVRFIRGFPGGITCRAAKYVELAP